MIYYIGLVGPDDVPLPVTVQPVDADVDINGQIMVLDGVSFDDCPAGVAAAVLYDECLDEILTRIWPTVVVSAGDTLIIEPS